MPQMVMITVKYVLIAESFRNGLNWSNNRYYPIYLQHCYYVSRGLSGFHALSTIPVGGPRRKHPIPCCSLEIQNFLVLADILQHVTVGHTSVLNY